MRASLFTSITGRFQHQSLLTLRRDRSVASEIDGNKSLRRLSSATSAVLETLETRQLLTAFVVNTLADVSDTPGSSTVSLRDAIAGANTSTGADTITFAPSLTAGGPATITLSSTLGNLVLSDVSGETTITGPGASLLSISGGNATQILDIDQAAATTSISGLTLTAAQSTTGGGAISNDGTLTITDCNILGNYARGDGGAIYSDSGSTLTITGSTISQNFSDDDGAGIYTEGNLTVSNTTFTGNHADDPGGAIDADAPNVSIDTCTFTNNNAEEEGGAIYNDYGSSGTLTINNSTFSGNVASDSGGALYNDVGTTTISGSTFSNNTSEDDENGGAIYNEDGSLTITGTSFTANHGSDEGGAIYNDDTSLTLTNCTFSTNISTYDGGGVYNDSTNLNVTGCTFSGNISEEDESGGGLYNDCTTAVISGTTFTGNSSQDDGGGVSDDCTTSTFTNCIFTQNSTREDGGGLYEDSDTTTITGCTFSNNSSLSDSSGGGIYDDSTMTINNSTIMGNSVTEYGEGGGIYVDDSLTLNNSTVSNNTADYLGGGIYNDDSLTINDSTISNNTSLFGFEGGGVYNDSTMTVNTSTISGNTAGNGGGIYNDDSLTVANCTISGNTATVKGGGIFNNDSMTLNNTIVAQNLGTDPDIKGAVASGTYNLIGDGTGMTGLTNGTTGNQVGTSTAPIDAKLGTLANNGGTTQTMALLSGSPAIDAGDPTVLAAPGLNDQRGFARVANGHMDIGAFEAQLVHLVVTAPATGVTGTPFSVTVTALDEFDQPVGGDDDLIHITSSDGSATLPSDATLDSSTGVGTFMVTPNTVGNQTVTATDESAPSITATSGAIAVAQGNRAPTDIALSNDSIATGQAAGTTVGTLSTTDPDTGDTFTYTLVSGTGSTDNADFTITGNTLATAAVLNGGTQSSYSVRIRSTDDGGLFTEKTFTITVPPPAPAPVPSLAFISPATTTVLGHSLSFLVHLLKADGTVNTTDRSKVSLSLVSGPTGGVVKGNKPIVAKNGAVKFGKISFTVAGTYVIEVSDGTYTPATVTITVTPKVKKSLRHLLASAR